MKKLFSLSSLCNVAIVLIVSQMMLHLTGCGVNNPAKGSKIGQVVKVTHSGVFSKTWEAQLIRGGMSNGSGAFGVTPFDFTIENEEQAKQVQEYMDKQTEVIITYRSEGIYSAFRTDSGGHFLETIRPATNAPSVKVSAERQ